VLRMRVTAIRLGLSGFVMSGALGWVLWACGSKIPTPHYVPQKTTALSEVPYAPPPARAEGVPNQPNEKAVWLDGEWSWDGRRWSWKQGRWLVPPPGASFAPWTTVRTSDGTLFFAPGAWQNAKGEPIPEPKALAAARVGSSPLVGPDGEQFPTGPTIRAMADAGP